jgi:hypothetical protein
MSGAFAGQARPGEKLNNNISGLNALEIPSMSSDVNSLSVPEPYRLPPWQPSLGQL